MNTTTGKQTVAELMVNSIEQAVKGLEINVSNKQVNGTTGRNYQGVNELILLDAVKQNKFTSTQWFTQDSLKAEDSKLSIKKDEKGTMIFNNRLVKTGEIKTKKDSNEDYEVQIKKLNYYYVFNKCQLEERA